MENYYFDWIIGSSHTVLLTFISMLLNILSIREASKNSFYHCTDLNYSCQWKTEINEQVQNEFVFIKIRNSFPWISCHIVTGSNIYADEVKLNWCLSFKSMRIQFFFSSNIIQIENFLHYRMHQLFIRETLTAEKKMKKKLTCGKLFFARYNIIIICLLAIYTSRNDTTKVFRTTNERKKKWWRLITK